MKTCLFVGPTLALTNITLDLTRLTLYGPAQLGSVYRAVEAGYDCIGLVDGYFGNVAPVWHKEILWALSCGKRVIGAASIGALRAAELYPYGMIGLGLAYRLFVRGVLTDDDEVCLIHASRESGYRQLSMPMLNIRMTLREMRRKRLISLDLEQTLVCAAKRLHFSKRTLDEILGIPSEWSASSANQLRADFMASYVDVKARDCSKLITLLSEADRIPLARPPCGFPETRFWKTQFVRNLSELPELQPY